MAMGINGVCSIAKLNYHQARPIWVSEEIQPFGCSNQYGNPSGHCFSTFGLCLAVWLDYNDEALKNPNLKLRAWYWRVLFFALGATASFTVAYSRLFLGVHSLNQVLFGALLGVWFTISAHFILKEPIFKICQDLIEAKENRKSDLVKLALVNTGIMISVYIVQIVNYQVTLKF